MAISIVRGSGQISNLVGITPSAPVISVDSSGNAFASFSPNGFNNADGSVQFSGQPTDVRAGWEIGWIQTEWIETNWGAYRGQFDHDGSMFLQRARPPARVQQGCRDTLNNVNTFFTKSTSAIEHKTLPPGGPFPVTVTVKAQDSPGDNYQLSETNSRTNKVNFLQEVQLEFMFCTVLTVRNPARVFTHLAHFYWNLRWQYQFHPKRFPPTNAAVDWDITPVNAGIGGTMGSAINGAPADTRFAGVLTSHQTFSCNDLALASSTAVETVGNGCRREFLRWESVDVRR